MKLPEELKRLACKEQMATVNPVYEAIVRDCAKVLTDAIPNWCGPGQARLLQLMVEAILARYSLEPKDSHD